MGISRHDKCRMPIAKAIGLWAAEHGIEPPTRSRIQRWVRRGIRGVKLKAELFGGRLYTSPGLVEEFNAAVNAAATAEGGAE